MKRIGWIGTGIMGKSMCSHLLTAGYSATIYNRTREKCVPLQDQGARIVDSPAQVAEQSDVVFVIAGYPKDVREVILGEKGVLSTLKPGGIVVDMTTSEPSLAKEIYQLAKARNVQSIDAPVSGGDTGAKNATLSIMIGGDGDAVKEITPMLQYMGKNIKHMGPAGSGQHTKMVNQILISTTMIGVVEGLLYANRAGLDEKQVIEAVGAGAAASWSINNLGPRIAERDFEPGFMVEHFIKDMGIALKEASNMGLALPGLAMANQFYQAVKAQGHERRGTQALMLVLEQLNGMNRESVETKKVDEEELMKAWIKRKGLNQYGDRPRTMYLGGTPLFDESTGTTVSLLEHMTRRHPDRPWMT